MPQHPWLLPLQVVVLLTLQAYSENPPFLTICSGDNFTSPSSYASNLRLLLSNLTASVPISSNLFSTSSVGSSPTSQLIGLAQCRPDATAIFCAYCLSLASVTATTDASYGCPNSKSAALRYDYCYLHYSNQPFLGIPDETVHESLYNNIKSSDPAIFNKGVESLFADILPKAASVHSRFAVGERMTEDRRNIYGLAWCSLDLVGTDCSKCLYSAKGQLVMGGVGGSASYSSCTIRFEVYVFFSLDMINVAPAAPLPGEVSNHVNGTEDGTRKSSTKKVILISVTGAALLIIISPIIVFLLVMRKALPLPAVLTRHQMDNADLKLYTDSLFFEFVELRDATNNFSEENKLGVGEFGQVYKGLLGTGQQIAVKRLSGTLRHGLSEMKNDMFFMVQLQHRNLVRLLGCCLENNEKLLVYEYLSNTSLDKLLFDPIKKSLLDWGARFKIIEGIGRGLLHLHEDSRLRIVHRDLKASNILLDSDMNPKISDFGLAKLFVIDETQRNSSQIAGTYGYMSPEYALHGLFSTKSDVFSYGVLVLEIITGKSNSCFQGSDRAVDLLSLVWQCWKKGNGDRIIDQSLCGQYPLREVLKCMHIGLLCVQDDQVLRPSMASLTMMLSSQSIMLPTPSTPAFYRGRSISSDGLPTWSRDLGSPRCSDQSAQNPQMMHRLTIGETEAE